MKMPHYLMQFFRFDHLPPKMRDVSAVFFTVAQTMDEVLPDNPEKTTALRKLVEAKDCAVRAVLFTQTGPQPQPAEHVVVAATARKVE